MAADDRSRTQAADDRQDAARCGHRPPMIGRTPRRWPAGTV